MNIEKEILNFNDEHCRQLFPEFEPKLINSIIESNSIYVMRLVSYLYNGKYADEKDQKRISTLKNFVAELLINPILIELYPEILVSLTNYDSYTPATAILNRVIDKYNDTLPQPLNINCEMFSIGENLSEKLLSTLGYKSDICSNKNILENITNNINHILNQNSTSFYFLAGHFFSHKKCKIFSKKNIHFLEFLSLFIDLCGKEIIEILTDKNLIPKFSDKSTESVMILLTTHIIECYNENTKF